MWYKLFHITRPMSSPSWLGHVALFTACACCVQRSWVWEWAVATNWAPCQSQGQGAPSSWPASVSCLLPPSTTCPTESFLPWLRGPVWSKPGGLQRLRVFLLLKEPICMEQKVFSLPPSYLPCPAFSYFFFSTMSEVNTVLWIQGAFQRERFFSSFWKVTY